LFSDCPIIAIQPFGVFVELCPGVEGLVHISELDLRRVRQTGCFLFFFLPCLYRFSLFLSKIPTVESAGYTLGQKIDVKVIGKNEMGKLRLSRRAVLLRENSGDDQLQQQQSQTKKFTSFLPAVKDITLK
jgi:predicted RNA-binding protein with RPS1 domain